MNADSTIQVVVAGCRIEADTVRSFELRPVDKTVALPAAVAGAHIDVSLPGGLVRQYSLTNPGDRRKYLIGVHRDPQSRGGSHSLHDSVRVGDVLTISVPRNNFRLHDAEGESVLVAGGIGVTPIYAMVKTLIAQGRPWTAYYCARSRSAAAYIEDLEVLAANATATGGQLVLVLDDAPHARLLDFDAVVQHHGEQAHFYGCGPAPLLKAFALATACLNPAHVHVEHFGATALPNAGSDQTGFDVRLSQSGQTYRVPADQSILEVLREAGVPILSSCCEGICGSCETGVLAGEPDHRDHILSPAERASNKTMMICVSRSRSAELTLDL